MFVDDLASDADNRAMAQLALASKWWASQPQEHEVFLTASIGVASVARRGQRHRPHPQRGRGHVHSKQNAEIRSRSIRRK
jgi:hypothetical protein